MYIRISDRVFEDDVKAGHAKVAFFILFDCWFKIFCHFCLFSYICSVSNVSMCSVNCMFSCLYTSTEIWVSSLLTCCYFFFVCWSQNAASLVLLRSPMQRQSGSNIGNFQKIIDFQKIAFAMCNLQCQWRTLFSQIKQKPSTWFENTFWGAIWHTSPREDST